MHEPIQGGCKRFDRSPSPVHEGNIVLTARSSAARNGFNAIIAALVQPDHERGTSGARDDDAVLLGAAGKLDHGVDNGFVHRQ